MQSFHEDACYLHGIDAYNHSVLIYMGAIIRILWYAIECSFYQLAGPAQVHGRALALPLLRSCELVLQQMESENVAKSES